MSILYKETAIKITEYIKSLPAGTEKIPSERELCSIFKVSRQTIRHALDECEGKGLIIRRQGSGIYLTESYQKSVNKIALLLPDCDEYIYPTLIHELEIRFSSFNYSVDIYETNEKQTTAQVLLKQLIKNPVSTIIIIALKNAIPFSCSDLFRELQAKGTNIIFIGNPYTNLKDYSYIKQDDYYGAYSIASRVIAHGKSWCAMFMHDSISSYDKYLGFTSAFNDLNVDFDEENIHWFSYDEYRYLDKNRYSFINRILEDSQVFPSVFICDNDQVAYWLIKSLMKANKYNDDMTIYSFDGSYILKIVDQKIYSYGTNLDTLALKIVEKALNKNKKTKEVITLPSSLHE